MAARKSTSTRGASAPQDSKNQSQVASAKEAEATKDEAAQDAAAAAPEEAEAPEQDELVRMSEELQEAKDRFVRLQAEWDNFRRRTSQERASERRRATERLVENLLPVLDDMDRAIDHAEANGTPDQALLDGISAVRSKFFGALEKESLAVIDPVGEAFDSNKHQAVGREEDDKLFDETVVNVYQKGYELGDKVLRPAMVVVSCGGPTRPAQEGDKE